VNFDYVSRHYMVLVMPSLCIVLWWLQWTRWIRWISVSF